MSAIPKLPSLYRPVQIAEDQDPRATACALAADGAEPATLIWSPRGERMVCAVVLAPDRDYTEAMMVIFVAAVALGDALGALVPAGVDVSFEWPGTVHANRAVIARAFVDAPADAAPDGVPAWLVVSAEVAVMPEEGAEQDEPDLSRTTLYEEGCFDATPSVVLQHFARYFLNWINRWHDDGFDPVRRSWINRTPDRGENVGAEVDGNWVAGKLVALRDNGDLVIESDGTTRTLRLGDAF